MRALRWIADRRAWFAIVVPYIAVAATAVVALGVLTAKSDAAQARADAAAVRADIATHRANEATLEAQQSCRAQQEAQTYTNTLVLTIAAAMPERTGDVIRGIVAAQETIEC